MGHGGSGAARRWDAHGEVAGLQERLFLVDDDDDGDGHGDGDNDGDDDDG